MSWLVTLTTRAGDYETTSGWTREGSIVVVHVVDGGGVSGDYGPGGVSLNGGVRGPGVGRGGMEIRQ